MDAAWGRTEVNELILAKSEELGSVGAALSFLQDHLLTVVETESAPIPHDVFPLRPTHYRPGQLCRCRGMIQEIDPNISLYRASAADFFGTTNSGDGVVDGPFNYSDTKTNDGNDVLLEALLLYVIPVPGNAHFYALDAGNGAVDELPGAATEHTPVVERNDRKRRERNIEDSVSGGLASLRTRLENLPQAEPQQHREEDQSSLRPILVHERLNLPHQPLAANLQTACIITIVQPSAAHQEQQQQRLCLNDVVEFFGFMDELPLTLESAPDNLDAEDGFGSWRAEQLSMGLLTRITCVAWRHLNAPQRPLCSSPLSLLRSLVLQELTHTLCAGDALLAEYLLLHLCAKVVAHASVTPVGDVPLRVETTANNNNCNNCNNNSAESSAAIAAHWSSYLRRVVPVGEIFFGEELFTKGSGRVVPFQDHAKNILHTGFMQLANGTHVTIDANAVAVAVVRDSSLHDALFAAIHRQTLLLQYPFQVQELPIDLSFLALTAVGSVEDTPLLQFAVSVRWLPQLPTPAAVGTFLREDEMMHYFTSVRRVDRQFETDVARSAELAESLVHFSQSVPQWNNHDSFIHNNSFSAAAALIRAHAASLGRSVVTSEDIEHVLSLERQRVSRR